MAERESCLLDALGGLLVEIEERRYAMDVVQTDIRLLEAGWELHFLFDFDVVFAYTRFRQLWDKTGGHWSDRAASGTRAAVVVFLFEEIQRHVSGNYDGRRVVRCLSPAYCLELQSLVAELIAETEVARLPAQALTIGARSILGEERYSELAGLASDLHSEGHTISPVTISRLGDLLQETFPELVAMFWGTRSRHLSTLVNLFRGEEPVLGLVERLYGTEVRARLKMEPEYVTRTPWFNAFQLVRPDKPPNNATDAAAVEEAFRLNAELNRRRVFLPIVSLAPSMHVVLNHDLPRGEALKERVFEGHFGLARGALGRLGLAAVSGMKAASIDVEGIGPVRLLRTPGVFAYYLSRYGRTREETIERIRTDRDFLLDIEKSLPIVDHLPEQCAHENDPLRYRIGHSRECSAECPLRGKRASERNLIASLSKRLREDWSVGLARRRREFLSILSRKTPISNQDAAVGIIAHLLTDEKHAEVVNLELDKRAANLEREMAALSAQLPEAVLEGLDTRVLENLTKYVFGLSRVTAIPENLYASDPSMSPLLDSLDHVLDSLAEVAEDESLLEDRLSELRKFLGSLFEATAASQERFPRRLLLAALFYGQGQYSLSRGLLRDFDAEEGGSFEVQYLLLLVEHRRAIRHDRGEDYEAVVRQQGTLKEKFPGDPRAYLVTGTIVGRGIEMGWVGKASISRIIADSHAGLGLIGWPARKAEDFRGREVHLLIALLNNLAYALFFARQHGVTVEAMSGAELIEKAGEIATEIVRCGQEHRWMPQVYDTLGCIRLGQSDVAADEDGGRRLCLEAMGLLSRAVERMRLVHMEVKEQRVIEGHLATALSRAAALGIGEGL